MGLDNDDIKQLIAILQKGLTDNNSIDDNEEGIQDPVEQKIKSKSRKTKTKRVSKNLFDNMGEASMHKDDVEIDRKLRKYPPTQRSRSYEAVKVRCRLCGKEDSVNPVLVESGDRYKCNKCSRFAG